MRRYIFTGAPGAGKTTLLGSLSDRGYPVVPEAATDVIAVQQADGVRRPWTDVHFLTDTCIVFRRAKRHSCRIARNDLPPNPILST